MGGTKITPLRVIPMRLSGTLRRLLTTLALVALVLCWRHWGVPFRLPPRYPRGAPGQTIALIATILVGTLTVWVLGIRMRHRIKRALGINVHTEEELTSLNTWMKVEDIEENNRGGKVS